MDPSRSFERYLQWPISYTYRPPGTSTMSFTHHSYPPIAKLMHTDPTILGRPLTSSKVKKNMKWKGSSITDILARLEPSNTLSSGRDTQKRTIPGNQLTRFTLHKSLRPITDSTHSKIKGDGPTQERSFASSPSSNNVCRRINQPERRVANVNQTPFSRTTFEART